MSAIDWIPGPLLRGMMDRGALVRVSMLRPGAWRMIASFMGVRTSRIRKTAQAAADAMEQGLRERMGREG